MISGQNLQTVRTFPSEAIALIVIRMLQELRVAEATLLLFEVYQMQQHKWLETRSKLLRVHGGFRQTAVITTILIASMQKDMSAFYPFIPGLKTLMDTTKGPRHPVTVDQQDTEYLERLREEFWEEVCNKNPEANKCKCFDL